MTTTVLISDETDKKIVELRQQLLHAGIGNISEGLREEIKKNFDFKDVSFTKGAVVGIAIVALLYFLKSSKSGGENDKN